MALLNRNSDDDRFQDANPFVPIIFISLFVIFIYGALTVGLLGIANWLIHAQDLTYFRSRGNFGVVLVVLLFVVTWSAMVFAIAASISRLLRLNNKERLARKAFIVTTLAFFNIFAFPVVLWPMVRNGSPRLRRRYRQKLKRMATNNKVMEERRTEGHG